MNKKEVYIIAEAGVNHNGSLALGKELIDIAKESGANAVKFQTFLPGECTGKFATKVDYIEKEYDENISRFDITQSLILPFDSFKELAQYAKLVGIDFLSTPDGEKSLNFVCDVLDVPAIKVASTELTNIPFLKLIAKKNKPIILSTGIGTIAEVEKAIQAITEEGNEQLTILHAVSEYPAPIDECNVSVIKTMKDSFGFSVGFSDHTVGHVASICAVSQGASVIEKHFTKSKNLPGPDHKASMEPKELIEFVSSIRQAESCLGDGIKKPQKSELSNMNGIRRSVVAKTDLKKGHILTIDNLVLKRPGHGIHPYDIEKLVGFQINRDLREDEPILWEFLK